MVRKIAGKGSRKSGNCLFLEKRAIQPKIPEEIQIERKFPARIEISEISE